MPLFFFFKLFVVVLMSNYLPLLKLEANPVKLSDERLLKILFYKNIILQKTLNLKN